MAKQRRPPHEPSIALLHGNEPIVAFVGAGASAIPPSSLPTWKSFNSLLLESLFESLAGYSRNRQPTDEMLEFFRTRRDQTQFFSPDFQAQLIEEEIGAEYFRVWQSLDSGVSGPAHAGLAYLARHGRLAAIVTLNFDRLIEVALTAYDVAVDVYHTADRFAALPAAIDAGGTLPLIKIHGSIEDTASLVDTLKQRVAGRPESLNGALALLLQRYPWMFLGFSGADLSYEPHYLGILDHAATARGFVFVAREGSTIEPGVDALVAAYGAGKATIVRGDLSVWLQQTFGVPAPGTAATAEARPEDAHTQVTHRIAQWVTTLTPMAVVNIICSMLRSSGLEAQALWLLRKTWKSYRSGDDTTGKSYDRYNFNYGLVLLDAGFLRNPIALADDMSNLSEWKRHADQHAFDFFARSYKSGDLIAAGAQLTAVLAYRGEVAKAMALGAEVIDRAFARQDPIDICEVAIASMVICDIVQMFREPAVRLKYCIELTQRIGDEPRRSLLCAHLGRLLTYSGDLAEADQYLTEAESVGQRLALPKVLLTARAVRGLWLAESKHTRESAIQLLQALSAELRARDDEPFVTRYDLGAGADAPPELIKGRTPERCRILLDLNRAALLHGDGDTMNHTLAELEDLTSSVFTGYSPHYLLAYAQCLLTHGQGDQRARAAEVLAAARQAAEATANPWIELAVTHIENAAGITPSAANADSN